MTDSMIFSLDTMRACNGQARSDGEYLRWFLGQCGDSLRLAAEELRGIANGVVKLKPSSLDEATSLRAEVRRQAYYLTECASWFSGKPDVAAHFTRKLAELKVEISHAETDYAVVEAWFR